MLLASKGVAISSHIVLPIKIVKSTTSPHEDTVEFSPCPAVGALKGVSSVSGSFISSSAGSVSCKLHSVGAVQTFVGQCQLHCESTGSIQLGDDDYEISDPPGCYKTDFQTYYV